MSSGNAPLCLLAGAPGAGKSTLLPHLLNAADGLVVMDIDELLEDGALIGVPIATPAAAPVWPAYDRMWRRIVTMVRRAGHPVLLLCQIPNPEDLQPDGMWDPPVRWALLDCPDEVRRQRLQARGSTREGIEDALADAAQGRQLIASVFHSADQTGNRDVTDLATQVLAWAYQESSPHRYQQSAEPVSDLNICTSSCPPGMPRVRPVST